MTREQLIAAANAHALKAWCWDDPAMIEELVDDALARGDQLPDELAVRTLIDEYAEHYDLTRPDNLQAVEAAAFRLMRQAGPAAVDTTGDLFGIPADLAAAVASRCASHRRTRPAEGPDLFA